MNVLTSLGVANTLTLLTASLVWFINKREGSYLHHNEKVNVKILILLSLLVYVELLLASIYFKELLSSFLIVRLVPTLCEYLYVLRLFNGYMVYLHLPRERKICGRVFPVLLLVRILLADFYVQPHWLTNLLIVALELILAAAFTFASVMPLRHYRYMIKEEIPRWVEEGYQEDATIYAITCTHGRLNVFASYFILAFLLNGTLWVAGKHFAKDISDEDFTFGFEEVSIASRVIPHHLILLNYLLLYCRDKNYTRKDKNFVFELKEVLLPSLEERVP